MSLIGHGHLNPYSTLESIPFWQVNGTWLIWPLAELTRLPPHGLILLWIQDLAIFGCAWLVLHWVAQAGTPSFRRHRQWRLTYQWNSPLSPAAAVSLVAILFVANPWVYWSAAFDFHWELPAAFFALMAAWDLCRGRTKRSWIWVTLTLATSDVSSFYVIAVGLAGLVVCDKEVRRTSGLMVVTGLAWLTFMSLIHANRGSILTVAYAYLAGPGVQHATLGQIAWGALSHPSRALSQLWSNRVNFWANLSPSGLLGVLSPWGLAALLTVLLPASLWNGHAFSQPSYQNFPAYPFVVLGSVLILGRLGSHWAGMRHAARPLAVAMAALAAGWAWAWLPLYPGTWLAVTPAGGRALAEARVLVPRNAEVVASNGVVGRFAGRARIYMPLNFPFRLPVGSQPVYFVLSTRQGVAYDSLDTDGLLAQVSGLGAQLIMYDADIWLFRWDPPPDTHSLLLTGAQGGLPAWLYASSAARVNTSGPPETWRVEDDGRPGLVLSANWTETAGNYAARVNLSGPGPISVQVWDLTAGHLLSSSSFQGSTVRKEVQVPFSLGQLSGHPSVSGLIGRGPFKIQSWPGSSGHMVDVRILDPGGSSFGVYTVRVVPVDAP
jgi:hypothetical protein